jgi:hypothetical protein
MQPVRHLAGTAQFALVGERGTAWLRGVRGGREQQDTRRGGEDASAKSNRIPARNSLQEKS